TGFPCLKSLYESVGRGRFKPADVIEIAFPGSSGEAKGYGEKLSLSDASAPLLVSGADLTPGLSIHMGRCCCPLPGDRIIGVHMPEIGLVVHTSYCGALAEFEGEDHEWVDLRWTELAKTDAVAVGRVKVTAADRKGVLVMLCSAVTEANANITRIDTGDRGGDFVDLIFDIEVEDVKRLTQILAAFRSLAVVDRAERLLERA
ncbi:MAG: ACT domain-containing protein, partial [Pseudomonadota bacterium]